MHPRSFCEERTRKVSVMAVKITSALTKDFNSVAKKLYENRQHHHSTEHGNFSCVTTEALVPVALGFVPLALAFCPSVRIRI